MQALYFKMVMALVDEQKQANPSEAVVTACEVAKRVIYREYQRLVPHA